MTIMNQIRIKIAAAFFLLAVGLTAGGYADEPTLEVSANRGQIYLGESVLLQIKVGNANNIEPNLSAISKVRIKRLGSQISNYSITTINNYQVHKEGFSGRIYTYEVTPTESGEFTLGPISLDVGGRTLISSGPALRVTGIEKQDVVDITVSATPNVVLVDEPFDVVMTIRLARLPDRWADMDPLDRNQPPQVQIPYLDGSPDMEGLRRPDLDKILNQALINDPNQAGFYINQYKIRSDPFSMNFPLNFNNPFEERPARFAFPRTAVAVHNRDYLTYTFTVSYTAEKEGNYTFGPAIFRGPVLAVNAAKHVIEPRDIFAVGPAVTVRVTPPPEEERPDSYIGAVGSNLTAEASLDAQTCNVGDPIKLTLTLNGQVQWRNVTPLRLSLQTNLLSAFAIYDDQVQSRKSDGQREFVYTIRPLHVGTYELPPIEVSYYNVVTRSYRTVQTQPLPLRINPAAEITAAHIVGGTTNTSSSIRDTSMSALAPPALRVTREGALRHSLWGDFRLIIIAALSPLVFFLFLIVRHIARNHPHIQKAIRRRHAAACAIRRLEKARHKATTVPQIAHREVCETLREFISDQFNRPAASVTPSDLESLLREQGLIAPDAAWMAKFLETHFNAAFGGQLSTPWANADEECSRAASILTALSQVQKKNIGRSTPPALLPAILILLGTSGLLQAESLEEQTFLWQEAQVRMSSARTPEDFMKAAEIYQQLLDRGVANGPLLVNLGTALLKANRPEEAFSAYERAEHYQGHDPDIIRGLRLANARIQKSNEAPLPWYRTLLFWHFGLSCAWRMQIAAGAFIVFWMLLAGRITIGRKIPRALIGLVLALFILFGTSAATSIYQDAHAPRLVRSLLPRSPLIR